MDYLSKEITVSERAYRIKWRNGQPHVEVGEVVIKGRQHRAKYPSEKKTTGDWEPSIILAIENELIYLAISYGHRPELVGSRVTKPWNLVLAVSRLARLHRRLKKHGIVPY